MQTLEEYTTQAIADEAARLNQMYGAEGGLSAYFGWIDGLRRECFERRAAAMDPTGTLTTWCVQMAARHGPTVRVFRGAYHWLAALGVARYGEAPEHWPAGFSAEDLIRANRWLYQGHAPEGVTYITAED